MIRKSKIGTERQCITVVPESENAWGPAHYNPHHPGELGKCVNPWETAEPVRTWEAAGRGCVHVEPQQPPLPPFTQTMCMKIQKVLFFLPHALEVASKRLGIRPLRPSELVVLYAIEHLPFPPGKTSIFRYLSSVHNPTTYMTIQRNCEALIDMRLIERQGCKYYLTYLGKEYIQAIRRNLIHRRLN